MPCPERPQESAQNFVVGDLELTPDTQTILSIPIRVEDSRVNAIGVADYPVRRDAASLEFIGKHLGDNDYSVGMPEADILNSRRKLFPCELQSPVARNPNFRSVIFED
jgi:hypothetical protein